LINIAIFSL